MWIMSPTTSPQTPVLFAWCFDHGTLHTFTAKEGPWCTAAWAPISAPDKAQALKQKERFWGPARFFGELPLDRQGGLIALTEERERLLAELSKSES
jgi:hypothetical protein